MLLSLADYYPLLFLAPFLLLDLVWRARRLPLWDMVFGTFRNPADGARPAGFYPGASGRLAAMLGFRDVSRL